MTTNLKDRYASKCSEIAAQADVLEELDKESS